MGSTVIAALVHTFRSGEIVTKTSELDANAFLLAVNEQISEERNKALTAGIPKEKIDAIVSSVYESGKTYSLIRNTRRVKSAIDAQIKAASASPLRGIFVGSRDRVGKNSPIRYTLVTTDGHHLEISNFGDRAQYQGKKIEIPVPSAVTIRALYDDEYDSYNLLSLEEFQLLDKKQLIKALTSVAIPIKDITGDMAYKQGRAARPVVIGGKISGIRPEAVFRREEADEGEETTAVVDHYLDVFTLREMAKENTVANHLPCFQFRLSASNKGGNMVSCDIQQQRHGTPMLFIEDLQTICTDALKESNDPETQAAKLEDLLLNEPVLVVGTVATFKKKYAEDKTERNYINLSVSCLVGLEGDFVEGGVQQKIDQSPAAKPHMTTETQPVPGEIKASPAPEKRTRKAVEPAATSPPPATTPEDDEVVKAKKALEDAMRRAEEKKATETTIPVPPQILNMARHIGVFCRGSCIKPTDITIDELRKKALDIVGKPEDIPDAIVRQAIDYLVKSGKV
jgi:hypothetical protein